MEAIKIEVISRPFYQVDVWFDTPMHGGCGKTFHVICEAFGDIQFATTAIVDKLIADQPMYDGGKWEITAIKAMGIISEIKETPAGVSVLGASGGPEVPKPGLSWAASNLNPDNKEAVTVAWAAPSTK